MEESSKFQLTLEGGDPSVIWEQTAPPFLSMQKQISHFLRKVVLNLWFPMGTFETSPKCTHVLLHSLQHPKAWVYPQNIVFSISLASRLYCKYFCGTYLVWNLIPFFVWGWQLVVLGLLLVVLRWFMRYRRTEPSFSVCNTYILQPCETSPQINCIPFENSLLAYFQDRYFISGCSRVLYLKLQILKSDS